LEGARQRCSRCGRRSKLGPTPQEPDGLVCGGTDKTVKKSCSVLERIVRTTTTKKGTVRNAFGGPGWRTRKSFGRDLVWCEVVAVVVSDA